MSVKVVTIGNDIYEKFQLNTVSQGDNSRAER